MGRASKNKQQRRNMIKKAAIAPDGATPDIPPVFQNVVLRPMNSLVSLRGKDAKQPLADGQMLITLDRYAIVPLEHYNDLLKLAKTRGAKLYPNVDLSAMRPRRPQAVRPVQQDTAPPQISEVIDAQSTAAGEDSK